MMLIIKKIIISTVLFFLNIGCSLPKLSLERKDIKSDIIKTKGFYYNKPDYWSFMLYQNGVFRGDFGVEKKDLTSVVRSFTDSSFLKNDFKIPYAWGLFEIVNDSIRIEHWTSGEWSTYGKTYYSGVILNDSTMLLNHPVVGKDTFHFYYLKVKPDSTNKFIK